MLTLLIEKWGNDHILSVDADPVQLLYSFMQNHNLKAKDLVGILGISKGCVPDILNHKKGFSKEVIGKLADYFRASQEAFDRPYKLIGPGIPD